MYSWKGAQEEYVGFKMKRKITKAKYVHILSSCPQTLIDEYMHRGGWHLIFGWTTDAIHTQDYAFLEEIFRLLLVTPMTVSRMRSNPFPIVIKKYSKTCEHLGTRDMCRRVVQKWIDIGKKEVQQQEHQITSPPQESDNLDTLSIPGMIQAEMDSGSQNKAMLDLDVSQMELAGIDFNFDILDKMVADEKNLEESRSGGEPLSQQTEVVATAQHVVGYQPAYQPSSVPISVIQHAPLLQQQRRPPRIISIHHQHHLEPRPAQPRHIIPVEPTVAVAADVNVKRAAPQLPVVELRCCTDSLFRCLQEEEEEEEEEEEGESYTLRLTEAPPPHATNTANPTTAANTNPIVTTTVDVIRSQGSQGQKAISPLLLQFKIPPLVRHDSLADALPQIKRAPVHFKIHAKSSGSSKDKKQGACSSSSGEKEKKQSKSKSKNRDRELSRESGELHGHAVHQKTCKPPTSSGTSSKTAAAITQQKAKKKEERLSEKILMAKIAMKKRQQEADKQKLQTEKDQETLKTLNLVSNQPTISRTIGKIHKRNATSFVDAIAIPGGLETADKLIKIKVSSEKVKTWDKSPPPPPPPPPPLPVPVPLQKQEQVNRQLCVGNSIPATPPQISKRLPTSSVKNPAGLKKLKLEPEKSKESKVGGEAEAWRLKESTSAGAGCTKSITTNRTSRVSKVPQPPTIASLMERQLASQLKSIQAPQVTDKKPILNQGTLNVQPGAAAATAAATTLELPCGLGGNEKRSDGAIPEEKGGERKGVLVIFRSQREKNMRPRKSVRWRGDEQLEQVHYFEMDESERVNAPTYYYSAEHGNVLQMRQMQADEEERRMQQQQQQWNYGTPQPPFVAGGVAPADDMADHKKMALVGDAGHGMQADYMVDELTWRQGNRRFGTRSDTSPRNSNIRFGLSYPVSPYPDQGSPYPDHQVSPHQEDVGAYGQFRTAPAVDGLSILSMDGAGMPHSRGVVPSSLARPPSPMMDDAVAGQPYAVNYRPANLHTGAHNSHRSGTSRFENRGHNKERRGGGERDRRGARDHRDDRGRERRGGAGDREFRDGRMAGRERERRGGGGDRDHHSRSRSRSSSSSSHKDSRNYKEVHRGGASFPPGEKNIREYIPCHFFKKGCCKKGEQCEFLHDGYSPVGQRPKSPPPLPSPSRQESWTGVSSLRSPQQASDWGEEENWERSPANNQNSSSTPDSVQSPPPQEEQMQLLQANYPPRIMSRYSDAPSTPKYVD